MTQADRIHKGLRSAGGRGMTNWQLSQLALKYTSVISELRKDGCNIMAERQTLKNGRASNTWRYYLLDDNRVLKARGVTVAKA